MFFFYQSFLFVVLCTKVHTFIKLIAVFLFDFCLYVCLFINQN